MESKEEEVLNLTQAISNIDQEQIKMRERIKQLQQELEDCEQSKKSMTKRISIITKKNDNRNNNNNQNNNNNRNNNINQNSLDGILSKQLRAFKMRKFRAMQKEIIVSFLEGRDCFVIMPSGGGKSLCYQLPAAILHGITLVICPLIALMNDQVAQLKNISLVVLILEIVVLISEFA